MTTAEIMEFAEVASPERVLDLLMLHGPDGFDGDYDGLVEMFKKRREQEWENAGAEKLVVNGKTWWAYEVLGDEFELYDEDGNAICAFDSMDELKFFVKGVIA